MDNMLNMTSYPSDDSLGDIGNISYQISMDMLSGYETMDLLDDPAFVFNGIFLPSLAIIGVIGNILNMIILSVRCNKQEINVLERGALLGLIALAVSDCCFCLSMVPKAAFYDTPLTFTEKNFHYYFQVYGIYFHEVFIKISTWLTVIIATARYVVICHPLKARLFAGLFATKVTLTVTYLIWLILLLPLLWSYQIHHYQVGNENISLYIIDLGEFSTNRNLKISFTYIWAIAGYFIPITILIFCNIKLIQALQQSRQLRKCSANSALSGQNANRRITLTLVCLIIMFIILVSPSEIIHFYAEVVHPTKYKSLEIVLLCTNLLQAINFAFHFMLYCAANTTFRRTLVIFIYHVCYKLQGKVPNDNLIYRSSMSITKRPTKTSVKDGDYNKGLMK